MGEPAPVRILPEGRIESSLYIVVTLVRGGIEDGLHGEDVGPPTRNHANSRAERIILTNGNRRLMTDHSLK